MKVLYTQSESHTQSHSDWMVCLPALCFSVFVFNLQLVPAGYSRKIIQESLLYGREICLIVKRRQRTTSTPFATAVYMTFSFSILYVHLCLVHWSASQKYFTVLHTQTLNLFCENTSLYLSVAGRASPCLKPFLCPASAHSPACMQGFTGISMPASSPLAGRHTRSLERTR